MTDKYQLPTGRVGQMTKKELEQKVREARAHCNDCDQKYSALWQELRKAEQACEESEDLLDQAEENLARYQDD